MNWPSRAVGAVPTAPRVTVQAERSSSNEISIMRATKDIAPAIATHLRENEKGRNSASFDNA